MQKLNPLVFKFEELANSCGQGFSSNVSSKTKVNGDLSRKPLDHTKTKVLKGKIRGKPC